MGENVLTMPSSRYWVPQRLKRELADAKSYGEWRAVAGEIDAESGALAWREDDESPHYDADLMRRQMDRLRELRERGDAMALVEALHEVLYRNLGDIAEPELYGVALVGTKRLVEAFLTEAVRAIEYLSRPDETGFDVETTRGEFERALHNFGRSALMLSGGATLGFFHLGVIKCLHQLELLPSVLSGASMGSLVASGVCSRNDEELDELFADTSVLDTRGIEPLPLGEMRRLGAILSPERLESVIRTNCGDYTFREAFERSGRVLNISLSPTRKRQKPRILNHLTAPDVLVVSAALASSAVPGVFPRAKLMARGADGRTIHYMPTESWIDGSFKGDLPMRRVSRLHNVNHFIVSQVNPHVVPFGRSLQKRGPIPFGVGLAVNTLQVQTAHALDLARKLAPGAQTAGALDLMWSLAEQNYLGDIDIYPRVRLDTFGRLFANLEPEQLDQLITEGERSTWPQVTMIREQTCIARALERAIGRLEAGSGG